ncbi:MAG TPA: NAD(P)H-dependent oxidoreductase subunit E, partial [Patescibacteria group bacterium]|nr:NAD(P)H-dependent oxidoreductase subunit E [Patescibacteria group bacterium]
MDLHVVAPLASPVEREAVDAVLSPRIGPPRSGWQGGVRDMAVDGHIAHGGHEARSHRDLLLPALHGVQSRIGFISQPALAYICRRLTVPPAEAYGVATFYALFATSPRPPVVAHVCDDIACRLSGAEELCEALERSLGRPGAPVLDGGATWLRSPCLGQCERAPAALFTIAGETPRTVAVAPIDAAGVVARLEAPPGDPIEAPSAPSDARLEGLRTSVPQAGAAGLRLLARIGRVDPTSLDDVRANGGYRALARAFELGPQRVIDEVAASKLVGRGGAAFPTGRKWAAVATQPARPHYLVCNADESEPGTFKDRALLEEDPFA